MTTLSKRQHTIAQNRQRILDELNTAGPLRAREISAALDLPARTVQTYLFDLKELGAINSENRMVARCMIPYYTAAVPAVPKAQPRKLKGVVHRGTERDHPHPNQGGQGNIGIQPRRSSIMDM